MQRQMPSRGNQDKVIVVGAGLAGALMAGYLVRDGYDVILYERRSDPRKAGADAGRSINLAISTRGLAALRDVGMADVVLEQAVRMPGRMIHGPHGELAYQPYAKDPSYHLNSVSRGGLNQLLIEAVEKKGVEVRFDMKCVDVDLSSGEVEFVDTSGGGTHRDRGLFVVGADGAFSAVRSRMQRQDRFNYSQDYLEHGYKELTIPATADGGFAMEREALHIWPRQSFMMIALPNVDGSYTCTLFWPFEGANSFAALRTDKEILDYFKETFPDAVPVMPTLVEDYHGNPTSSLVTIRCGPWYVDDRVVLIGDACHAVVPFYGQGANAAFEDCTVLAQCLREYRTDRGRAFVEYFERRKHHCDTLADLAVQNFIEMRDKTGSRLFRLKKKTQKVLSKLLPGWYVPLYTMVSFTTIPYGDAVRIAHEKNKKVVASIIFVVALVVMMIEIICKELQD